MRRCNTALGDKHPWKGRKVYHMMYRYMSEKKKTRMVKVKGEPSVDGGKCIREKNSPYPRTVTLTSLTRVLAFPLIFFYQEKIHHWL